MSTTDIPEWKKRLPTQLTFSRVFFGFFIVAIYPIQWPYMGWITGLLFIFASLTDYWDGLLARRYNVTSNMGKLMDPATDKILVTCVLTVLLKHEQVDLWAVLLLVSRDLLIGGLRSVAAANGVIIDAKTSGKWKTALQLVAIPCLLIQPEILQPWIKYFGTSLLWISVALSMLSGIQYTLEFYKLRR